MIKNILNLTLLTLLNFLLLKRSRSIDVDQLFYDIEALGLSTYINRANVNFFIGISVSILTLSLIYFFKPFIEIYLLHYLRYSFYLLINLLSISTIYITYRIYGYSRLFLILYLITTSFIFILSDKNYLIEKINRVFGK